jgi:alpha-1,2-mannosyltransferase
MVASRLVEKADTACVAVAAAIFLSVIALDFWYYASQSFPSFALDIGGVPVGRDFLNTWVGGRSAFSGGPAPWFDLHAYNAALQKLTGDPDLPPMYWSYPPDLLIFVWPFGLIPFLPSYVLWCVAGLALYMWAAFAGGLDRKYWPFLLIAPAVAMNIFFGQNGFLTAALLIGGLANLDRRPTVAGILFGILTVKPQFGLLLPVMLVVSSRWRVIAVAAATSLALVALTALWFGPDVWTEYLQKVVPQQHWLLVMAGKYGFPIVSTTYVNARAIGLPDDWAWGAQALSSGFALIAVIWTFRCRRDPVLSFALFVTATFLFSPWMLTYDMVVLAWVVTLLRTRSDETYVDHGLALAVWMLPVLMYPFGFSRIGIALLVLPLFAARLVWRLARASAVLDPKLAPA